MTFLEAQKALCRKLNIDYDDIANNGLFSLDDIKEWINFAALRAWDYKPWDFTEGDKTITSIDTEYYDYPEEFMTGSVFPLTVAGEEYTKLDFKDYLKYKQDNPTEDEKVFAERKRWIFINQLAYSVGDEIIMSGKLKFTKLSGDTDLLPFSPDEDDLEYSGNMAIVLLAYSDALGSDKKKNSKQSQTEEKKAFTILDILWKPFADFRANQQSKNRPFFDVPDFYGNTTSESFGNFNLN